MNAEELISIFLEGLWANSMEKMKAQVSQATVDNSRFHVVVTLPAIWPDYARQRMHNAVQSAGILEKRAGVGDTILTFVSEPEAAAVATLKAVDGRYDIEADDIFIVCDCGGGTVDIISYEITSTDPMAVKEVVKGAGALCGSIFVGEKFEELLRRKVDEVSPGSWGKIGPVDLHDILTDHVFEPAVERIKSLIHGQTDSIANEKSKSPKYIMLVGGFGRCKYLYEYLKDKVNNVEVLQSQDADPWTAIARGAVIHGMTAEKIDPQFTVQIRSRISRASYGIVCQEDWDEEEHRPEDKIWDDEQQKYRATMQMKCEASPPPSRMDETVIMHSEVKWTAKIDMGRLPVFINNRGEEFYQLDYATEMRCSGGSTEFAIFHNGKRQGAKNVSVDFYDHADI
ncbi:hypothetical protein M406DRAFT_39804 [Cryphonectria parasitica EP155]|uniref:Uncharacterized protein n=1 Tax=Cryphonectria parasitica (strain ATCC 38755 / EP155) TaxID=660469 RepID=A0A9P5CRE0_CRYP1|nr:uncharacterized protein M406DRAFT_39804 [Cryphonectria parasitica EP155]KAF3767181.1 hypothetical protein M406DRAFT_39804 [Cryphonectria parasitica EP155]